MQASKIRSMIHGRIIQPRKGQNYDLLGCPPSYCISAVVIIDGWQSRAFATGLPVLAASI